MSRSVVLTVACLASALAAHAQPARPPRPLENVKVLTAWSSTDVRDEMRKMTEALGVTCDHCHVQGNFASDEKRPKHTARRMMQLTLALNGEYFSGYDAKPGESKFGRVTCYTCHQGAATPKLSSGAGEAVK